jgi:hypothetical protein
LSNLPSISDNFSLASVGATNWNTVNVAYFVMSSTAQGGNGYAATSGPAATGGSINTYAFWGSYNPAASSTIDAYRVFGTVVGNSSTLSQSNTYSYWNNMNGGGTMIGTMGNYLASGNAETNLAGLSTTGYVDQVLFYYGSDPDSGAHGTRTAYLRTFADGHTAVTATDPTAQTPIPAAVYLFGSGLMGLVGLRRKMAA